MVSNIYWFKMVQTCSKMIQNDFDFLIGFQVVSKASHIPYRYKRPKWTLWYRPLLQVWQYIRFWCQMTNIQVVNLQHLFRAAINNERLTQPYLVARNCLICWLKTRLLRRGICGKKLLHGKYGESFVTIIRGKPLTFIKHNFFLLLFYQSTNWLIK